MELKLSKTVGKQPAWILLIVPYGIETTFRQENPQPRSLLIVPYGIETEIYVFG